MAENSAAWKKPSEVMRLRRKRKSSLNLKRLSSDNSLKQAGTSPGPQSANSDTDSMKRTSQKRRNPFGCSPRKKANISITTGQTDEINNSSGNNLLSILCTGALKKDDLGKFEESPVVQNLDGHLQQAESGNCAIPGQAEQSHKEDVRDEGPVGDKTLPVDWSLKTKARFISPKSFTWCTPLKTVEESSGVTAFTRARRDLVGEPTQSDGPPSDAAKTDIQKHILYWQHPNLPWFRAFPRIVPDHKLGKAATVTLTEEAQKALMADWTESFMSVFTQLRGGLCPYFYLCAHQFTVIFRAAGICGKPSMHAILTPTSRGIRESLRREGIEFTLPLVSSSLIGEGRPAVPAQTTTSQDNVGDIPNQAVDTSDREDRTVEKSVEGEAGGADDDGEGIDDIADTDEGASSWLEELGLDRRRYRSLDPSKIKLQRESFRVIDNRAESLVYVEGGDTNALFNFLLNCRSCIASTGPQAGIPPTLLAPAPFKGATLKPLKLKTSIVHQKEIGASKLYSLEVEGALLPHHIHGLTHLFSLTQSDFSATFNSHDQSAPLNCIQSAGECDHQGAAETLQPSGIGPLHIDAILQPSPLGKLAIRETICHDGRFTWSL